MAVSALRTVVTAHVQGSVNRARKQLGDLGVLATALAVGGVLLVFVVPVVAGLTFLGFLLGDALAGMGDVERNLAVLAGIVSFVTLGGGLFAGLSGVSRQLPWENLQAFPVSRPALFGAELVAGATELITASELLALLGLCLGVTVGAPRFALFVGVLFLTSAFNLLTVQLIIASVAQRISRQARAMVVVLPVLAFLMSTGSPRLLRWLTSSSVSSVGGTVQSLLMRTPAGAILLAAQAAHDGRWSACVFNLSWTIGFSIVLVLAAYWLVSREKELTGPEHSAGAAKPLWSFSSPKWGVARLQWQTLSTSMPGRIMLLMPLFTVVLIRGPLAEVTGRQHWVVPASFLYAGLASTNLLFNQFGLDRHGVKALLLLPLDERAILEGKRLAFAGWQVVQSVLLIALLVLAGHADPAALLLGVALGACSFLITSSVGQFVSVWQPQPLAKSGMRGSRPPLPVIAVTMVTVTSSGGALFGLAWLLHRALPQLAGVIVASIAVVLGFAAQLALTFNAQFLRANRERVVESLSASA